MCMMTPSVMMSVWSSSIIERKESWSRSTGISKQVRYSNFLNSHLILKTFLEYANEKDIRYDGIFVSLTDCMNRASVIDNIKYVAVADFDEILMPKGNFRTLTEFLKKKDVPDAHSFVFLNVFFFAKFENFQARRSNSEFQCLAP